MVLAYKPVSEEHSTAFPFYIGLSKGPIGWELLSHADLTKTATPAWAGGRLGKLRGGSGNVPGVGAAFTASKRQLPS